jgi:transposase
MGVRYFIDDEMWSKLEPLLPQKTTKRGRPCEDTRRILEGIIWVIRTGAPWRDMPEEFGSWQTCYTRLRRWNERGVWEGIFALLKKRIGHPRIYDRCDDYQSASSRSGLFEERTRK